MSFKALWRFLIFGPPYEPQEGVWAFRQIQKAGQRLIEDGELQPPRVLWKTPNPRKVLIGQFKSKLLRMKARA